MVRIIQDGPWSFDNQLLLLRWWQKGMTVENIKLKHASLWIQIWGALFDMVSPQVAKEVGSRLGIVEEVEWKQRHDDPNFFMHVKVALPIGKPLRRGSFITGSDDIRTWVLFKYERLPLFCHYCGMLGHDVKHCASHFAITQNGGEIEFQYGESLHAMGGWPRSFSPRKTSTSAGAAREQQFGESTCNSPSERVSLAASLKITNPSRPVEIDSVTLRAAPIFQGVDNVEKESNAYVQHEVSNG